MAKNRRKMATSKTKGQGVSLPSLKVAPAKILSGLLILCVVGVGAFAIDYLSRDEVMPIQRVVLSSQLNWQSAEKLQAVINQTVQGNFVTLNVSELRTEIESLPWIAHAGVRRNWPDTIAIAVKEEEPRFRWQWQQANGLINQQGELLQPTLNAEQQTRLDALPLIECQPEQVALALTTWAQVSDILATARMDIEKLWVDQRHSVRLLTSNGLTLVLGRDLEQSHLRRFIAIYWGQLQKYQSQIARIDLRYTNGFSIAWQELSDTENNSEV